MATSPASTRTMPAPNGARNRCISGAVPTTSRRRAAKACATPAPASGPIICTEILPRVLGGEKVLVAAHGNSLRSLVMVLDRLTRSRSSLNLATGVPMVYKLNADSTVASKEVLEG